jgi:hypothetical protein
MRFFPIVATYYGGATCINMDGTTCINTKERVTKVRDYVHVGIS